MIDSLLSCNNIYESCSQQMMSNCYCSDKIYKPLCLQDKNENVFQSACVAGCQTYNNGTGNCSQASCLIKKGETKDDDVDDIDLVDGLCSRPSTCYYKLILAYVAIFFIMFFTAISYIPYMKVTIGCVTRPEMNAIALGIKQLAMTGEYLTVYVYAQSTFSFYSFIHSFNNNSHSIRYWHYTRSNHIWCCH